MGSDEDGFLVYACAYPGDRAVEATIETHHYEMTLNLSPRAANLLGEFLIEEARKCQG